MNKAILILGVCRFVLRLFQLKLFYPKKCRLHLRTFGPFVNKSQFVLLLANVCRPLDIQICIDYESIKTRTGYSRQHCGNGTP